MTLLVTPQQRQFLRLCRQQRRLQASSPRCLVQQRCAAHAQQQQQQQGSATSSKSDEVSEEDEEEEEDDGPPLVVVNFSYSPDGLLLFLYRTAVRIVVYSTAIVFGMGSSSIMQVWLRAAVFMRCAWQHSRPTASTTYLQQCRYGAVHKRHVEPLGKGAGHAQARC